jgi:hypothetical protein
MRHRPPSIPFDLASAKGERGATSFVLETGQQAVDFYRRIVQDLRAWQPSAPKLPDEPDEPKPGPPPFSAEVGDPAETVDPPGRDRDRRGVDLRRSVRCRLAGHSKGPVPAAARRASTPSHSTDARHCQSRLGWGGDVRPARSGARTQREHAREGL